jgi:hypothetical protein
MFVLSEIDGHNENAVLARAATPVLLLGDFKPLVRYWRVTLDGEDIATVAMWPRHSSKQAYIIYGTNPYCSEETICAIDSTSMVQVVREHLQRFYDLGLYARDDFPGIRAIPLTSSESVV